MGIDPEKAWQDEALAKLVDSILAEHGGSFLSDFITDRMSSY